MIKLVLQKVRAYLLNLLDALLGRAIDYVLEREELISMVDGLESIIMDIANSKGSSVGNRSVKPKYKIVIKE